MKKTLGAVVVSAAVLLAQARPAQACGGCFHGPTASPMTVDAHRMVLAISPTSMTLWDQIVYGGEPSELAWVLPVSSEAQVELADNAFFEALTRETMITMQAPFGADGTGADRDRARDRDRDRVEGSGDR
jgi:hypothetical protein